MMECSSGSSLSAFVSENSIRYLQSKIRTEIENFEKHVSELSCVHTIDLCEFVKDRILNYEDEPHLSKAQNNIRRIYIASELIVGICSIHDHIVDFAFKTIINDLLHLDKYKIISKKITHKAFSNLKKENYFAKEAHTKLLKSLKDNENGNLDEEVIRRKELVPEGPAQTVTENELEINPSKGNHVVATQKEVSLDEIGQTLLEDSFADDRRFNLIGDVTEVRLEPPTETSNLNVHIQSIPNDGALPTEISIREPLVQQPMEEDIEKILQSGDRFTQINIRKSGLTENLLEPLGNIREVEGPETEKWSSPTRNIEDRIHSEEDVEEWNFSTLEPVEIPKKKRLRLMTDKLTKIPGYKMRAMNLNKNIEIRRVQVFEGPPKLLQSMSPEYLMKTTSFKKFWSQNVRSSMLNRLYNRNLTTENRPVEPFVMPKIQKRIMESNITETETQTQRGLLEEIGEKIGMRKAPERSGVLAELVSESRHPEISVKISERDSLIGLPTSKVISPVIQPPEEDKICNGAPIPSPRIQKLQGTTLDSKKNSPPWFFSTKEQPPRSEFRNFDYVKKKLHNYWSLFKTQGMEESISIREFLLLENDGNFANFLTILRIVDKLSIQRQLFLDYKNGDILIKPFENPYVTNGQLLLQGKEQIV